MRAREAKQRVIDHLEAEGLVVYDQRVQHGLPMMGQLVAVDPADGVPRLVRVLTGKRPPRSRRVIIDRRRVGICDLLAVVDPRDGSVSVAPPASRADAPMGS